VEALCRSRVGGRYAGGPVDAPPARRYRCSSCGNLTRFTVVSMRRTSAFHHFTVGGELTVEDEEVLDERVESVECRWCGTGSGVVELSVADAAALGRGDGGDGG
jgi:hypothetical protein